MKTVYIGADHAGFYAKNALKDGLSVLGYDIEDLGAFHLNEEDDYPEFAATVASAVQKHPGSFGILLCGSAEGMCMAANKFNGIRAGIGFSQEAARLMRTDDDANILCIPSRLTLQNTPKDIARVFLETPFSHAPRHMRRIAQIDALEDHPS